MGKSGKKTVHAKLYKARLSKSETDISRHESAAKKKFDILQPSTSSVTVQKQLYFIANTDIMNQLLAIVQCNKCKSNSVKIHIEEGDQKGFASKLVLMCDKCGLSNTSMSSPKVEDGHYYDINTRLTMFSHEVGGSYRTLEKLSESIGIPAIHKSAFYKQSKRVSGKNQT